MDARDPDPEQRPAQRYQLARVGDALVVTLASFLAAVHDGTLHWRVAIAAGLAAMASLWFTSRVLHQYEPASGRGFLGDLALTLVLIAGVAMPLALLPLVSPRYAAVTDVGQFLFLAVPAILSLRFWTVGRTLRTASIRVLVVGTGALGRITGNELAERGRSVVGFLRFEDDLPNPRLHAAIFGTSGDLEATLKDHVVDEVYFAPDGRLNEDAVQDAIRTCERLGEPFALPVCPYRLGRARPIGSRAIAEGFVHYLSIEAKPFQRWIKRAFDIVASGVALLLLSPLLVATAVAVKATSRGPVFFRQQRVGQFGRRFDMLKFRSMVANAEALKAQLMAKNEQSGPVFKMTRDPRVTAVGRFIRKYSIDELPQLVNVLRGDMSIVGPRPPIPSEVARYETWQRRRLSVRPGLTCVWQVSGRNQISFEQWMLLDMSYIDHWSLLTDFSLIAKTVPVVLTGRGAS